MSNQLKPGLSGYVCVRNAVLYDYPVREAVLSLVPVCDEVVISYAPGDNDGTEELVHSLAASDSRIRVVNYEWKNPERDIHWWTDWLNWTREQLRYDTQITLDADEVLDPISYNFIRYRMVKGGDGSHLFERLNFWQDAHHLAPENRACGTYVARMGPTSAWMCSDEPNPRVEPNIRTNARKQDTLRIFHYGFIRDPKAFVKKSVQVQTAFFGSVDSRITEMDAKGRDWREREYFDGEPLREFTGRHPEVARQWLRDRGYDVA